MTIGDPNVGHVRARDVVAPDAFVLVVGAKPVDLHLERAKKRRKNQ